VLVVGGGDGGTVREVLKHPGVATVEMVEIDGKVVELCREYLPETSQGLDDPRVTVVIGDGIRHVAQAHDRYDVIIIDSSEPIGPGAGLFTREFYLSVFNALRPDGLMVAQSESPFVNAGLIRQVYAAVADVFPVAALYTAAVPTYPSGLWSFTLGSKRHNPRSFDQARSGSLATRYYSPEVHAGAFLLPRLVRDLIR
jgi:spermidine synthase